MSKFITMKIGVIGSGNIGGTLGTVFAKAGHEVFFSSRHPAALTEIAGQTHSKFGTVSEAAQFGQLIIFAFPYGKLEKVREEVGDLANKIIIDINNYYPGRDGAAPARMLAEHGWRQSEYTAHVFPEARVVKAFNSIWYKNLESEAFKKDHQLAIPVAGDDKTSKKLVMDLMSGAGYDPVDIGGLSDSRVFEPDEKLYNLKVERLELLEMM